jgi:hypothetical protein
MGYKLNDFDSRTAFTWKALREMDIRAVQSVMDGIVSADNKLCTGRILRRLLSNVRETNEIGVTVYDLYDGSPPGPVSHLSRTFPPTETHFFTSESNELGSDNVEGLLRVVRLKSYEKQPNSKLLILANPEPEGEAIMSWRAGHESRPKEGSETEGPLCKYDFLPAAGQPPFLTPAGELVGEQVPGEWNGIAVEGSYGPTLVVLSDFFPTGYVAVVASYGPNSAYNCIGFREHRLVPYQGLRRIAGDTPGFPLVNSFAQRSFGVGVRQRGAAAVCMVDPGTTYVPPDDLIPV